MVDKAQLAAATQNLQDAHGTLQVEFEELQARYRSLLAARDALQAEKDRNSGEFVTESEKHMQVIVALKAALEKRTNEEIPALQDRVARRNAEIDTLKAQVDALERTKADAERALAGKCDELDRVRAESAAALGRTSATTQEREAAMAQEIDLLIARAVQLEKDLRGAREHCRPGAGTRQPRKGKPRACDEERGRH